MKPSRLSICLSLAWLPAIASSAADLADLDIEALVHMKVESASKFEQPLAEAPSSVSVVTHEEIRAHGWRTLAEVLQSIKGLNVSYDRSYSYLGVRGFSAPGDFNTRFLLLVDGFRVNDAIYNQAYLGNEFLLDVDTIERVEFVPGAGSSIYGSNAVLGVINVITRDGKLAGGARVSAETGTWSARQGRFSWGHAFDGGGDLLTTVSRLDNGGRALDIPGIGPTPAAWDAEQADKAFVKWRNGELTLSAAFLERQKNSAAGVYGTTPGVAGTANVDRQLHLHSTYQRDLGQDNRVEVLLGYVDMSFHGDYAQLPDEDKERDSAHWWTLETRWLGRLGAHHLIAGLEYDDSLRQQMHYLSVTQPDPAINVKSWNLGAYVQDEWAITERLTLHAGVRHDHYSSFGGTTNPRLALIWRTRGDTTLKLTHGSAYRAPNVYELYYQDINYDANPSLRPETVKSWELIAEKEFGKGRLSATLFDYRLDNLIQQVTDANDKLQFQNVDGVEGRGVEIGLDYGFAHSWVTRSSASFQYVRTVDGGSVRNSPRTLLKSAVRKTQGSWKPAAELQYVGDRIDSAGGKVAGYWFANLSLTLPEPVPGMDVSLHIRNLFDRHYTDPLDDAFPVTQMPQDGRSFSIRIAYRF